MKLLEKLKSRQIFKDSFWALFGSVVGKGLSLLGGILVARILTKDIYGEYGLIKTTLLYIAVFSTFGFGFTSTRFISKFRTEAKERVYTVIQSTRLVTFITSSVMALLLAVFAVPVADYLNAPHLSSALRISAIAIIFNAFDTSQVGMLSGLGAFKINARNTAISGVVSFVLSLLLTMAWGLNGAIYALLLSLMTSVLLNFFSIQKILQKYERKFVQKRATLTEMVKFSLPVALQESFYSITHWATSIMLVKLVSYGEMGLSSAAGQWSAVVQFIPGVLRNVTLSHLSGNTNNKQAHNNVVNTMLKVNFITTFIPWIIVVIFSGVISKMYGASYSNLPIVLILSVGSALPNCISNVFSQELISRGKNWFLLVSRLAKDLLGILFAYLVLSYTSLPGAAALCGMGIFVQTLYLFFLWSKYKYDLKKHGQVN